MVVVVVVVGGGVVESVGISEATSVGVSVISGEIRMSGCISSVFVHVSVRESPQLHICILCGIRGNVGESTRRYGASVGTPAGMPGETSILCNRQSHTRRILGVRCHPCHPCHPKRWVPGSIILVGMG